MSQEPTVEVAPEPLFLDISPDAKPIQLESLCMVCQENGMSTILLTKIPFFREVMISRFECPHCLYEDRRVQFAGEFPSKGVHFELTVTSPADLNRRLVKSGFGVVTIPQINFEIPGPTQADSITTVEGVLQQAYGGLKSAPQTPALAEFLDNLSQCAQGRVQFTFILDDPSGNSFIENPMAPAIDPNLRVTFYRRTREQTEAVGLMATPNGTEFDADETTVEHIDSVFAQDTSVLAIPTPCTVCGQTGNAKSCTLNIPHFKEIIIMSFSCESCGYRNGELMIGGGMSPTARRVTCRCQSPRDLTREVIKSELAAVKFPECGLELLPGTLGGKFTTIEGLVTDIEKHLKDNNPFSKGDSAPEDVVSMYMTLKALKAYRTLETPFTLILDDPVSNSYIQEFEDTAGWLIIEDYTRTEEQNELLGITDMLTEPVETEHGIEYRAPQ
jgi:zinc finger protein